MVHLITAFRNTFFYFVERKFGNWQQCLIPSNDLISKTCNGFLVPYKGVFCLLVIRYYNCFYFAPSLRLLIILTLNFSSFSSSLSQRTYILVYTSLVCSYSAMLLTLSLYKMDRPSLTTLLPRFQLR